MVIMLYNRHSVTNSDIKSMLSVLIFVHFYIFPGCLALAVCSLFPLHFIVDSLYAVWFTFCWFTFHMVHFDGNHVISGTACERNYHDGENYKSNTHRFVALCNRPKDERGRKRPAGSRKRYKQQVREKEEKERAREGQRKIKINFVDAPNGQRIIRQKK